MITIEWAKMPAYVTTRNNWAPGNERITFLKLIIVATFSVSGFLL